MSEKVDFPKLKILLIDDEHFMLDVIARALRGIGVNANNIVKAGDCIEAVGLIIRDSLRADIIIADFNMKPVNGLQFLQKIRTGQEPRISADQTFIMLTGNARSEVVTSSVALDVNAYLVKPVPAVKLSEGLERALSLKLKLKSPEQYQAVNIQVTEAFNDAEDKQRSSSAILPPRSVFKPSSETSFIDRKKAEASGPSAKLGPGDKPENEPIISIRRCSLEKLKEKMVLAEDIADQDGMILVGTGTTLTTKLVERLRVVAADRKFVLIEKKL